MFYHIRAYGLTVTYRLNTDDVLSNVSHFDEDNENEASVTLSASVTAWIAAAEECFHLDESETVR